MDRHTLRTQLSSLDLTRRPDEVAFRNQMIALLDAEEQCFHRSCFPGHFTASAFIVSADGSRTLLNHHRKLNRWLRMMETQNPPPLANGRPNRLRYMTQIKARPPTFALWVSRLDDYPDSHGRYLINGLRRDFDLPAVPVRFVVRASKNPYAD